MVAGPRGLQLQSIDQMWRFAQCLAMSGMAPKGMEKVETLVVALEMGAELGLPPMAAVQNIAVINGRPSLWGDAMLALCRGSGFFDEAAFEEVIRDGEASCTVRRLPHGKPITRTFGMDDAKRASLTSKSGPWGQYPKRMLQMRARSWALRDAFADALRGIASAEEQQGIIDVEAKPTLTSLEGLTRKLVETRPDDGNVGAMNPKQPAGDAAAEAPPEEPDATPPAGAEGEKRVAAGAVEMSELADRYTAEAETAGTIKACDELDRLVASDPGINTAQLRVIREAIEARRQQIRARRHGKQQGQGEMFDG